MTKLILRITCGFGNQLFFIFNAISLSIDNNLEFIIDPIQIDRNRPSYTKYLIFANPKLVKEEFDKRTRSKMKNILIKQDGFIYNKINLNIKSNYNFLIDANSSGFFQSYKFFWHNKEKIKEYLNLPNEKFNLMYGKMKSFEKKTIGIHIRLTDYIKYNKYFYNYPVSYYQKILAQYNLSEYNIILFSDDTNKAISMFDFLPRDNIILADSISLDDEDQFYLLTLTNIRICPNSTFSLWTCYLNEIYNFVENPIYWFGNKWFGINGPKYILSDLIPQDNLRFNVMDI